MPLFFHKIEPQYTLFQHKLSFLIMAKIGAYDKVSEGEPKDAVELKKYRLYSYLKWVAM